MLLAQYPQAPALSENNKRRISVYFIAIWLIYLLFSPVYIFPKGLPQPADILLALGVFPALATIFLRSREGISYLFLFGALFAALTFCVNWVNYMFFPHQRFIYSSLYYIYNFLVFAYVVLLMRRDPEFMADMSYAVLVVVIIGQFFWAVFFPDQNYRRNTASFANPNQLAYWSLLTASMLVFLKRGKHLTVLDFILLGVLGYIQTLALSKAGMITYAVFLFFVMLTPLVKPSARMGMAFILLLVSIYGIYEADRLSKLAEQFDRVTIVMDRLSGIGSEPDETPEGRGYMRIVRHPEYTIFGAGEGAFHRFSEPRELHSGLATLLFSYGILGVVFFGSFIGMIFLRQPWYYAVFIIPIILYGITHQNIRFNPFLGLSGACVRINLFGICPCQTRIHGFNSRAITGV